MKFPGYPNATHYSPHYLRTELDCHCGCKTPKAIQDNLAITAAYLEDLRAARGGHPQSVSNAYRCAKQNAKVRGKPGSLHMQGKAADVNAPAETHEAVAQLAKDAATVSAFKQGGIGTYDHPDHGWFVHVDWRGYVARWTWETE